MSTHFSVDRGRLVEPRHLTLVVSNDWPTEADTDQAYEGIDNACGTSPIVVAFWCAMLSIFIGVLSWAAI